jgi:hypothetical protein
VSARQVRKTVRALLEDPMVGLKPTIIALANTEVLSDIVSDFNFVRGALSGKMLPSALPNVAVNARTWNPEQKVVKPQRDSRVIVDVSIEFFGADQEQLEDQADLTVIAVVKVLDGLREYSDANGGTIVDVEDPYRISIGQFGGPITTEGFLLSATIIERSTV